MGIWGQIIFLKSKFWEIYEKQSDGTKQKIVFNKFEGLSCARKRLVAF